VVSPRVLLCSVGWTVMIVGAVDSMTLVAENTRPAGFGDA
jgi:hypothetical protein